MSQLLDVWSQELAKMQQQQQQQQPTMSPSNSVSPVIIPPSIPAALQTLVNGSSTTRHRFHQSHSSDRATTKIDDWAQVQENLHTRVSQVIQRGRDLLTVRRRRRIKIRNQIHV